MKQHGYNGKILFVDLGQRTTKVLEPEAKWWRVYGGGGLLGTYFMLSETPAGIDAFDEKNLLIFASSVIAGIEAPGLARFSVVTKSPLSGGIAETRCEGRWGHFLKGSGYDAIIVSGSAETPIYLHLEQGSVTFADAGSLWGKDTFSATKAIEEEHGKEFCCSAVIGQAGENRVRFASIVTDYSVQAARTGVGAVMGSKKLKAIVLSGKKMPPVFDRDELDSISARFEADMLKNELSMWQKEQPGFSAAADLSDFETAYIGKNNFQSDMREGDTAYNRENYLAYYKRSKPCPGCPNDCIKVIDADSGYEDSAGIHQEVTGAMGPNIGNNDIELMLRTNVLCNRYGLDPVSLGFTISFAMECFQEGILLKKDTGGIELVFGANDAVEDLVSDIALRRGFGDILAEGSRRASERFGAGAEQYALHVKGVEMVSFEPRTQTNLALGYATAPVGPRYDICEHDWDFDTVSGWHHTLEYSRSLGILQRIPMEYVGPEKVKNYKVLNTIWSAFDVLDLCVFAGAPTRVLSLEMIVKLIHAVTGWKSSSYEVIRWGERRNHLMRIYNLREGLGSEFDILPARFYNDPIKCGRLKGSHIDRERFSQAVRMYYEMMGWDDNGVPRDAVLWDYGLDWTMPFVESIRNKSSSE